MFEELEEKAAQSKKEVQYVNYNIQDDPSINKDLFKDKLGSLDHMTDLEIHELVKHAYPSILDGIMHNMNTLYIGAFTNTRFLSTLIQVLGNMELSYDQKICCNKLVYDYITLDTPDDYVRQLMLSLSKIVNRNIIPALMSIGLPEDIALQMSLSRFSSIKEDINVKRLNFVISTTPKELVNSQHIIWIYQKLFNHFTPLFEATMFDVYDENEDWITDDIMEVYSTISLAVLDILNDMPSDSIRKVLTSYTGDYEALHSNNPNAYRFSLRALSEDYERILNVVDELQEKEKIYVP